jgi:hypothetical protein
MDELNKENLEKATLDSQKEATEAETLVSNFPKNVE